MNEPPDISRREFDAVIDGLRAEQDAKNTTTGVQIGAVEKTLTERIISTEKALADKITSVKLWGALALVGGQTVAAMLVKWTGGNVTQPAHTALEAISQLLQ